MNKKIYDVIILGAGPAGLAAGLYAGRAKLSTLIIDKGIDGGQIVLTHEIQNYPGQANIDGERGQELISPMSAQCIKFGCERVYDTILSCNFNGKVKNLWEKPGSITPILSLFALALLRVLLDAKMNQNIWAED